MSRLDEIKLKAAKSLGYTKWDGLFVSDYENLINEVLEQYAKEAVEAYGNKLLKDESFWMTNQDGDSIEVIQVESIKGITIDLP